MRDSPWDMPVLAVERDPDSMQRLAVLGGRLEHLEPARLHRVREGQRHVIGSRVPEPDVAVTNLCNSFRPAESNS